MKFRSIARGGVWHGEEPSVEARRWGRNWIETMNQRTTVYSAYGTLKWFATEFCALALDMGYCYEQGSIAGKGSADFLACTMVPEEMCCLTRPDSPPDEELLTVEQFPHPSFVKSCFMPADLFPGSPSQQAVAWASILARVDPTPFGDYCRAVSAQTPQSLKDVYWAKYASTLNEYERAKMLPIDYQISLEGLEFALRTKAESIGANLDESILELCDELESKTSEAEPSLEFRASWLPVFVHRYSAYPAGGYSEGLA